MTRTIPVRNKSHMPLRGPGLRSEGIAHLARTGAKFRLIGLAQGDSLPQRHPQPAQAMANIKLGLIVCCAFLFVRPTPPACPR